MKILLLGHMGYLGSYLYHNISADTLENRNVYDNGKKYDYVINCIGRPSIEYCENHVDETDYSNCYVINDIKKYYPNAKIINFSSYYVYDDENFCKESSNTTTSYAYTRQNLQSERLVTNGVSFRLGKLFGNPYQRQGKLFDYILENDDLTLDTVLFNPTSVQQVLRIVENEIQDGKLHGVYNLSNLGFTSPYELGIIINDMLQTNKKITKIEKMDRPFHNYGRFLMDITKLYASYPLVEWKNDLIIYIKN